MPKELYDFIVNKEKKTFTLEMMGTLWRLPEKIISSD